MPKKKQLAWKIAEIASDNATLDKDSIEMVINRIIGSFSKIKEDGSRPLKFYEAALFQIVNPKAWTISSMAASGFLSQGESLTLSIFYIGIVALIICPLSISPWAAFGSGIKNMVNNNKIKVIIEFFLAFLLLITAILIVIGK